MNAEQEKKEKTIAAQVMAMQRMTVAEAVLKFNPDLSAGDLEDPEALRSYAQSLEVMIKDSYGSDSHGGVPKSWYEEMDPGLLRDFMDDEQLATDMSVEGVEYTFGGTNYVFFPG